MVYEYNQVKNLTGFRTVDEIYKNLVEQSIRDLTVYNVPRGTLIADLGSGNGVPGIVLSVLFPEYRYLLVDSNEKKCAFLCRVVADLALPHVSVYNGRAEEASSRYRNRCGIVVSRAFGPVCYSLEFGLCMLQEGGHLYVYSNKTSRSLSDEMMRFAADLGAAADTPFFADGIAFRKVAHTPEEYPRKFPVIKRFAARTAEFK